MGSCLQPITEKVVTLKYMLLCVNMSRSSRYKVTTNMTFAVLTLFGLEGDKIAPLRVFAKYLKNGLANLYETL